LYNLGVECFGWQGGESINLDSRQGVCDDVLLAWLVQYLAVIVRSLFHPTYLTLIEMGLSLEVCQ
jgi:hypothetical protein